MLNQLVRCRLSKRNALKVFIAGITLFFVTTNISHAESCHGYPASSCTTKTNGMCTNSDTYWCSGDNCYQCTDPTNGPNSGKCSGTACTAPPQACATSGTSCGSSLSTKCSSCCSTPAKCNYSSGSQICKCP